MDISGVCFFLGFMAVVTTATSGAGTTKECPHFNQEQQVCCNGLARERDSDKLCCKDGAGIEIYIDKQHCDGDKKVIESHKAKKCTCDGDGNLIERHQIKTCGEAVIHLGFQGCCGGKNPYTLADSECCVGFFADTVIARGTTCCHGLPLEDGEICCKTRHRPVKTSHPSHTECCYNSETGDIFTHNTTVVCNGGNLISEKSIDWHIFLKTLNISGLPWKDKDSIAQIPAPTDRTNLKHSGKGKTQYYSPSNQTAASPSSGEKKQGNGHLRCDGELFTGAGSGHKCCGKHLIDTKKKETCCGPHVLKKGKNQRCCKGVPFNKKQMRCKEGIVTIKNKVACKNCKRSFAYKRTR